MGALRTENKVHFCMYLQFGGGSRVISANSFWILFADVDNALDPKDFDVRSLVFLSRSRSVDACAAEDEFDEDIINYILLVFKKQIWSIRWQKASSPVPFLVVLVVYVSKRWITADSKWTISRKLSFVSNYFIWPRIDWTIENRTLKPTMYGVVS